METYDYPKDGYTLIRTLNVVRGEYSYSLHVVRKIDTSLSHPSEEIFCKIVHPDAPDAENEPAVHELVDPHPNIVRFHEILEDGFDEDEDKGLLRSRLYMEYCTEGNLEEVLKRYEESANGEQMPEAFIWHVLISLLRAVARLQLGVLDENPSNKAENSGWNPVAHNDIHLDNVLLTSTPYVEPPSSSPAPSPENTRPTSPNNTHSMRTRFQNPLSDRFNNTLLTPLRHLDPISSLPTPSPDNTKRSRSKSPLSKNAPPKYKKRRGESTAPMNTSSGDDSLEAILSNTPKIQNPYPRVVLADFGEATYVRKPGESPDLGDIMEVVLRLCYKGQLNGDWLSTGYSRKLRRLLSDCKKPDARVTKLLSDAIKNRERLEQDRKLKYEPL